MPVEILNKALPALQENLNRHAALNDLETIWDMLRRLLSAHAPTGGANLLGGVGDDIAVLADSLGLRDRITPHLGSTGNTALWLGADKPVADVVVTAHMDRPSFRVRSLADSTLYPICANRFPPGEYRVSAKAVRFERGRLVVSAEGMLVSRKQDDTESVHFESKRGKLDWHDTVMIHVHPARDGQNVVGTGLDNSLGVLTTLLTVAALRDIEGIMRERERRCVFVFTDQEEGPQTALFGQGAARLMHTLPPPTYGCVVVTAHAAGPDLEPQLGQGACHGTASRWGQGSIVPPNYCTLAVDLARNLNVQRPGTVQMNHGYISRSDDVLMNQWARVLALIGPPTSNPNTGYESAQIGDIQDSVWWLAYFLAVALNLVPELTPHYALGR